MLGPVNKLQAEEYSVMKGVVVEDNFSSHKTDVVNEHWCTKLAYFISPVLVPSNMMSNVQVVDRHIGVCYKKFVHRKYWEEMHRHLNEKLSFTAQRLTPDDKRILITND